MTWNKDKNRHSLAATGVKTRKNYRVRIPPLSLDYEVKMKMPTITKLKVEFDKETEYLTDIFTDDFLEGAEYTIRIMTLLKQQLELNPRDEELNTGIIAGLLIAHNKLKTVIEGTNNTDAILKMKILTGNMIDLIEALNVSKDIKSGLMEIYTNINEQIHVPYLEGIYKGQLDKEIELVKKYYDERILDEEKMHPLTALYIMLFGNNHKRNIPLIAYSLKDIIKGKPKTTEDRILKQIYAYIIALDMKSASYAFHLKYDPYILVNPSDIAGIDNATRVTPLCAFDMVMNSKEARDELKKFNSLMAYNYDISSGLANLIKYIEKIMLLNRCKPKVTPIDYILLKGEKLDHKLKIGVIISDNRNKYYIPNYSINKRGDVAERIKTTLERAIENALGETERDFDTLDVPSKYREHYDAMQKIVKDIKSRKKELIELYRRGQGELLFKKIDEIIESSTKSRKVKDDIKHAVLLERHGDKTTLLKFATNVDRLPEEYIQRAISRHGENIVDRTEIPKEVKEYSSMEKPLETTYKTEIAKRLMKSRYFKKLPERHKKELICITTNGDSAIGALMVGALLDKIEPKGKGR